LGIVASGDISLKPTPGLEPDFPSDPFRGTAGELPVIRHQLERRKIKKRAGSIGSLTQDFSEDENSEVIWARRKGGVNSQLQIYFLS